MASIFTQVGEEILTDLMDGTITVPTWHIDWGIGTTAAVKGDTGLETPSPEARIVATMSQPSADQNQWFALITASASRVITEVGIFTLLTSGLLFMRGDFAGISLDSGDKIEFTLIGTHS